METRFATESAPADRARLIFMREGDSHSEGGFTDIYIDGARAGKVERGGFAVVDEAPGARQIAVAWKDKKPLFAIDVVLVAGEKRYLLVSWRDEYWQSMGLAVFGGIVGGVAAAAISAQKAPFKVEPVDEAKAKELLAELRLSEERK